jgi:hypothetical protein
MVDGEDVTKGVKSATLELCVRPAALEYASKANGALGDCNLDAAYAEQPGQRWAGAPGV